MDLPLSGAKSTVLKNYLDLWVVVVYISQTLLLRNRVIAFKLQIFLPGILWYMENYLYYFLLLSTYRIMLTLKVQSSG